MTQKKIIFAIGKSQLSDLKFVPYVSFLEAPKPETNRGNETKGGETIGGQGSRCFQTFDIIKTSLFPIEADCSYRYISAFLAANCVPYRSRRL